MIEAFTKAWFERMHEVRAMFEQKHPDDYKEVVKAVISMLAGAADYGVPDPERIHEIDDGAYRGTLVYVIAEKGCKPSTYWYVRVGYGSCSGCDTLKSICNYSDKKPDDDQVRQYMTLALHIVQGLREMGGDEA